MRYQDSRPSILVIGDVMLDRYIEGTANRLSPEAPVAVLNPHKSWDTLGGAANVANNLACLGAKVELACVLSNDTVGLELQELLKEKSIHIDRSIVSDSYKTIHKDRILAKNQQIVRIDYNDFGRPSADILLGLCDRYLNLNDFDCVVISDYAKGICTDLVCRYFISECKKQGVPVIVDPKGTEWDKYSGATVITPNLKEISDYLGRKISNEDQQIELALLELKDTLPINNILLTRSECGMTLCDQVKNMRHMRSCAKEVYDVSGAGDTVVATLAFFMGQGAVDLSEAVRLSNIAAGIVVRKLGTSTVSIQEIQAEEAMRSGKKHNNIYDVDELDLLSRKIEELRREGRKIVTTNGCFDVIHRGHIELLKEAKKQGDVLIVGLNSDASVRRLKGESRPINGQYDRAYVLSAVAAVDAVAIFDEHIQAINQDNPSDAPMSFLKTVMPDIHVKGGDYNIGSVPEAIYAKRFVTIPYVNGHSSTKTIEHFKSEGTQHNSPNTETKK